MKQSTITVLSVPHGMHEGMTISFTTPDTRWWMRLWYFVTFRSSPVRVEYAKIVSVDSSTEITVGRSSSN